MTPRSWSTPHGGGWACLAEGCGVRLPTRQRLREHVKEAHPLLRGGISGGFGMPAPSASLHPTTAAAGFPPLAEAGRWACSRCPERFGTRDLLRAHTRVHRHPQAQDDDGTDGPEGDGAWEGGSLGPRPSINIRSL